MAEPENTPSARDAAAEPPPFRDDDGALASAFLDAVVGAVEAGDAAAARALCSEIHEADLGELLQTLRAEYRTPLVELLGETFDFTALTEVDEATRLQILEELPRERVIAGLSGLDSNDAVYILEDLDDEEKADILAGLPPPERIAVQRSLDYPEESAGRRMQTDFVAVPPFWTVGQTIDYLRTQQDLPDQFYEIYVIDPRFRLLGSVSLDRVLRAPRPTRIGAVMHETRHLVHAVEDQEEVARMFERYNLVAAAVVDDAERLVGVLSIDDVVDVIQAEAEEDLRAMSGVGDEEVSDRVFDAARGRFPWLLINLCTAFLAASVIRFFEGTIEQMVALAVLMPIVASIGGNTGNQTMTIAVRALALRELGGHNASRVVGREVMVGLVNGLLLSIVLGLAAAAWFGNLQLGGVIAVALVTTMTVAGLVGILVPLTLNKLKRDPASGSSIFVTMFTDMVGFLAFLGFATWWFGLG